MVNDPDVRVERIKLRLKKGTIVFSHINSCLFQINCLHFVSNMSTFLIPTPPSTQKQVNRSSGPVPSQEWIPFECLCRSGGYCSNNQTQSRIKRERITEENKRSSIQMINREIIMATLGLITRGNHTYKSK